MWEIVNAILYVNRTGIQWQYLPHDFPPYKTVYDYYAKWETDGTTRQVHDLLRDRTRRAHGHSAEPTAAVVDAQSVKTSADVAGTSQGIDAGKKIKGRHPHGAVQPLTTAPPLIGARLLDCGIRRVMPRPLAHMSSP